MVRDRCSPAGGEGAMAETEFDFELPHGYVDAQGVRHRKGTMRRATARDELAPLGDLRVRENPEYLGILLLSNVVTRLGTLRDPTASVIEGLHVGDVAHLQEMYERINSPEFSSDAVCPTCGAARQ
ncbi:hypothetical protein [Streptomyces sp. MZ04]|uniref:hypothetical protein n=1 Tax=Streptomyces sp. MZ04 TaxID=2559236 RepID=UPI00107ECE9B|nr:hypothetical protein [Streptomyces sp. MZ04]TGB03307.1 hypothetical protein E2651_25390 [Streptomyces sp. MZ04]